MERPVVENKIAKALKSFKKGSILFVDDFLDYGNSESVKKALLRLKQSNSYFYGFPGRDIFLSHF